MIKQPTLRTTNPATMKSASGKPMQILQRSVRSRCGRAADRDLAQQLDAIAESLARHRPVLNELLPDTTSYDCGAVPPGHCALFDVDVLAKRKLRARRAKEDHVVAELDKAAELGVVRSLATAPALAKLHALQADFPHFAPAVELMRQRCALAKVTPGQTFAMPPILLSGPPGVGKTAFAEAVAECLGLPFRRVDIASSTAGFVLAGSHSTWQGGKPGVVWELLQARTAASVLLLDEIDKAADSRYPVLGPLYVLLERNSARNFADEYIDMPVDASHLTWLATCNRPDLLDGALHSRFVEFEIPMPTADQMVAIARSVYRRMRSAAPWAAAFDPELPDAVIDVLTAATPRQLIRLLEDAHARAAGRRRCWLHPDDFIMSRDSAQCGARRIGFI